MLEVLIDFVALRVHSIVEWLAPLVALYRAVVLIKFPYGFTWCIAGAATTVALKVRKDQGTERYYWLHSLILTIISGFGGGMVAFVMLGKPPIIVSNEWIVPLCIVAWYCTHYLNFGPLLNSEPFKIIIVVLTCLFRTHSMSNIVALANRTLAPSEFYHVPIVGPIIVGTTLGSFSLFMPLTKGLDPITHDCPWAIQGAFLTSTFYHLMINDTTGFLGNSLRAFVGSYSEEQTRMVIATVWILHGVLQNYFDATANLFTPLHQVLYLVFQVDGPRISQKEGTVGWEYRTRLVLERWIELCRVLAVVAVICAYVYHNMPLTSLAANTVVESSSSRPCIATCRIFSQMRFCQPYRMFFEVTDEISTSKGKSAAVYRLRVEKGQSKTSFENVWNSTFGFKDFGANSVVTMSLANDGLLSILRSDKDKELTKKGDEVLLSKRRCVMTSKPEDESSDKASAALVHMTLNRDSGLPEIVCSNSQRIPLEF